MNVCNYDYKTCAGVPSKLNMSRPFSFLFSVKWGSRVGRNVGAGMTGGLAYFLDEDNTFTPKVSHLTITSRNFPPQEILGMATQFCLFKTEIRIDFASVTFSY